MYWIRSLIVISIGLLPLIVAGDPCRFEDTSRGIIDLTSVVRTDSKFITDSNYSMLIQSQFFLYETSMIDCRIHI